MLQLCDSEQVNKPDSDYMTLSNITMTYTLEPANSNETNKNEIAAREEDCYNNNDTGDQEDNDDAKLIYCHSTGKRLILLVST